VEHGDGQLSVDVAPLLAKDLRALKYLAIGQRPLSEPPDFKYQVDSTARRPPFPRQRLLDLNGSSHVRCRNSFKQLLRPDLKVLAQPGKNKQRDRIHAALDCADCLPMNAEKFGKAFLREIQRKPPLTDNPADLSQECSVIHPQAFDRNEGLQTSSINDAMRPMPSVNYPYSAVSQATVRIGWPGGRVPPWEGDLSPSRNMNIQTKAPL